MPRYARRNTRKRKRYYKKKLSRKVRKKTYKVSIGKLQDTKINSLVEYRIKQIAQQTVDASIVHLIDRQFFFGQANRPFNHLSSATPVYYLGLIRQLGRLDKSDIQMVANNPDANDPGDDPMNQELELAGAQLGARTVTQNGYRNGNLVLLDGVSIAIKAFVERGTEQQNVQAMDFNSIFFKWAVVAVYSVEASLNQAAQTTPDVDELLPYHTWGYSKSLDSQELVQTLWTKKRTLLKGHGSFMLSDIRAQEKTFKKYVKFSRPLKMEYLPADQNGYQSTKFNLWFVCRSNIPHVGGGQNINYSPYAPKIMVCSKIYYHE